MTRHFWVNNYGRFEYQSVLSSGKAQQEDMPP